MEQLGYENTLLRILTGIYICRCGPSLGKEYWTPGDVNEGLMTAWWCAAVCFPGTEPCSPQLWPHTHTSDPIYCIAAPTRHAYGAIESRLG